MNQQKPKNRRIVDFDTFRLLDPGAVAHGEPNPYLTAGWRRERKHSDLSKARRHRITEAALDERVLKSADDLRVGETYTIGTGFDVRAQFEVRYEGANKDGMHVFRCTTPGFTHHEWTFDDEDVVDKVHTGSSVYA